MPYLSDGSHFKPHFPFFDISVINKILMHRNSLISPLSNQISQRCIEMAVEMRIAVIDYLYLEQPIIQVVNKMDEIHLIVVYGFIEGYLDVHYFGYLLL